MDNEVEVTLHKMKLAFLTPPYPLQLIGGKITLTDAAVDDWLKNYFRAKLTGYLLGEPGEDRVIKYPLTWRDAFKLRWFPTWLLDRFPAVMQVHEINLTTLYPYFQISLPDKVAVLKFTVRDHKEENGQKS